MTTLSRACLVFAAAISTPAFAAGPSVIRLADGLKLRARGRLTIWPQAGRFQMVADARLRPLAPSLPDRHTRIDDWRELGTALAKVIRA